MEGGNMKDYSIEQLGIFVVSVLGALGVCIKAIQQSRCDRVECGCIKVHRNVATTIDSLDELEEGRTDGDTTASELQQHHGATATV